MSSANGWVREQGEEEGEETEKEEEKEKEMRWEKKEIERDDPIERRVKGNGKIDNASKGEKRGIRKGERIGMKREYN